ncbi:MAG TPA: DUF481 domain-containing protein [Kofleriaceae bacterium]|nr:DUF481 domain-containing protein [Kofleriaceae bacterium]
MRPFVVLTLVMATAAPAAAQKFEYGKYDDVKDVKKIEWLAAAEGGIVLTTGNSETTTATAGLKASRKEGNNKLTLEGSGAYAKAGLWILYDRNGNGTIDDNSELLAANTITAETLAGKLRYDRFLTELNSLFIAALASRDLPAGKELVFGGQLGYSRSLYKSKTANTVGEFGYDFSREDLVAPGDPVAIHSLRAFIGHHATMTTGTDLDAAFEVLTNLNTLDLPTGKDGGPLQDTRVNTKIAITAKIGQNLAFQTALEAKYDHRPGPLGIKNLAMGFTPEAATLDTLMKASFIYTFVGATPK